jgi:hypothetical protein
MIENSTGTLVRIAATSGLILGFLLVVSQIISIMIGTHLFTVAAYITGIICSTLAYRNYHHLDDGSISYGRSLIFGILTSGFTFVVVAIFQYIQISISPDEFLDSFDKVLKSMKEQGYEVSDIDENLILNPFFLIVSFLVTGLFTGLAVASITSIFTKKEK